MTRRQLIALARPCARGPEVLHPDFRELMRWKGMTVSSILSVNK